MQKNLLPGMWLSARPTDTQQMCLTPSCLPSATHSAGAGRRHAGTEWRELDRGEEEKARAAVPQALGLETGQRSTDTLLL